ncbi:MAG: cation transporting ATPase C-terminal domain-containing protein [Promethearchaeota archaeon]
MILIDDNYATIVNAIEEGRGIFETTKGFFRYMLSTNFDEIFLILVAYILLKFSALGLISTYYGQPIEPIQILWLNIATDGIPAMVLGLTPTDPDVLYIALWAWLIPSWASLGIDPYLTMNYTVAGTAANAYAVSLAQTILFTNLVICELMFVYTCTSNKKPFWLFPNKHLFWATGLSFIFQLVILYTPVGIAFHVVPLYRGEYWLTAFIGAFSVSVMDEVRKYIKRKKEGLKPPYIIRRKD